MSFTSMADRPSRTARVLPLAPSLQFAVCILQFGIAVFVTAAASSAAVRVEAYRGEPFGIGRVTIDLQSGAVHRARKR